MNALLDTHALLWWVTDDARLSRRARRIVEAGDILVSVVSLWEIEFKRGLGRVVADTNAMVEEVAQTQGFDLLDVRTMHILTLAELPDLHRDPFDRMLIAQAKRENVPLLSRARTLRRYPVEIRW